MARFRKASPIRENLAGILAGIAAGLFVLFLTWAGPRFVPMIQDLLFAQDNKPPVEETQPPEEAPLPSEDEAPPEDAAEPQGLGTRLWAACKRFWPALLAFVAVMEAAEYIGKFFLLLKKLFRL